jgi:hypothetical protein
MHRTFRSTLGAVGLMLAGLPCQAQLYSTEMPGLQGFYGGISGQGHTTTFNFGQTFPYVGAAWLDITGIADVNTSGPVDVGLQGRLEGVWGPPQQLFDVTVFQTNLPLTVSNAVLDGAGTVNLYIGPDVCCDHSSKVLHAALWFCTGDPDLTLQFAGPDELTWNAPGGAIAFDLLRGDLGALRGSGGDFTVAVDECLGDNLSGPPLVHSEDPRPGEGFWYLMRRITSSGNASYDSCSPAQLGGRDAEIAQSGLDCS